MSKKIRLFAPCAFNLAETTRMLEIAEGVANAEHKHDDDHQCFTDMDTSHPIL
jgi:hypothetical protein